MLHLLLDLIASRLKYKPVPFGLLDLLTQVVKLYRVSPEVPLETDIQSHPFHSLSVILLVTSCWVPCDSIAYHLVGGSNTPALEISTCSPARSGECKNCWASISHGTLARFGKYNYHIQNILFKILQLNFLVSTLK